MFLHSLILLFSSLVYQVLSISLLDDVADFWLPLDAPPACIAAFNTPITCVGVVQLLNSQTDYVGWTQNELIALCSINCRNSLANLKATVQSACGNYKPAFNGHGITPAQLIDCKSRSQSAIFGPFDIRLGICGAKPAYISYAT